MRKLINLAFALMLCIGAKAQFSSAPAFPGAEGYGRYTVGGRGGTVYHVTNLNDKGEGSLRAAIEASGSRIVVFDVSGTIDLASKLTISNGYISILGQTAPGQGICLKGYPVYIDASNVIMRFIRCRMGDINKAEDDALGGLRKQNIIIDHCTMSWSTDECGSFYGNQNFTLQWCFLTESLCNSVHDKGSHGYGGIWGGHKASFHHNLLAHHVSRNARLDHDYVNKMYGPIDYVNNVIYNWRDNVAYGGESKGKGGENYRKINFVGNYYKPGPATKSGWGHIMNLTNKCSNCNSSAPLDVEPAHLYLTGNILEGNSSVNSNNWNGVKADVSCTVTDYKSDTKFTDADFNYNTISIQSASDAYSKVVASAGASYSRDDIDKRIAREVTNGTYTYNGSNTYDSKGQKITTTYGIIDTQEDVNGWCALAGGTKPADTDKDGMPDEWEEINGLNPNDASDGKTTTIDKKGYYTNVEVYCNSLVEDIVKAERAGATETFEEYYPAAKYYKEITIETPVASGTITYPFSQDVASKSGIADYAGQPSADIANYIDEASTDCGEILGWAKKTFTDKDGIVLAELTNGKAAAGEDPAVVADGTDNSAISFNIVPADGDVSYSVRITGVDFYAAKNGTGAEASLSATINDNTTIVSGQDLPRANSSTDGSKSAFHCSKSDIASELGGLAKIIYKGGAGGKQFGISDVKFNVNVVTVKKERIIIDPTGISEIVAEESPKSQGYNSYYYNLQGQRVSPSTKGIVIYQGKKYFNP